MNVGSINNLPSQHEIVLTGLGVICPLGFGRDEFWQALQAQQSGVRRLESIDTTGMRVTYGGEIHGFDPKQFVRPRKSLKVMSQEIQWAFAAADLAMTDAGISQGELDPERLGVVLGCDMIYSPFEELIPAYRKCIINGEFQEHLWGGAIEEMYPLWMLKHLPNMPACHIGIAHDARGPVNTIVSGDVSSLLAIHEAMRLIERGAADVVITGGTGNRLHPAPLTYRGGVLLANETDAPEKASKPFDRLRTGIVNGEGAGVFVLESREHAQRRGARPLVRMVSSAAGFEPLKPGQPQTGSAITHTMQQALSMAGLGAEEIGHVNAHGLSTQAHDRMEAQAIRAVLGDVPVTAPKSYFGNLGSGGGAVELAVSVLGLQHGQIPVTLNYEQPDPECPVQVVRNNALPVTKPHAMILNQATTGQAAALVVEAL